MVYLEIRKPFNKEYYILIKNIRLGPNKWKKLSKYLGNKKPSSEDIEKATKLLEYEAEKLGLIKEKTRKRGKKI